MKDKRKDEKTSINLDSHPECGRKYFYVRPDFSTMQATCAGWFIDFDTEIIYAWMQGSDGLQEKIEASKLFNSFGEARKEAQKLRKPRN